MTTQNYILTKHQGGFPQMIGQSPAKEFTGKVYGARCYSSDLSVWLSVDPLGFARPNNSPYFYVQLKPIIRKDPNGIAAAGPISAMFDIGGVSDSYGNTKLYFTMGWAMSMGASGGMGYGKTNKNFRYSDINGYSSGWQFNVFIFSGEICQDMQNTAVGDIYGNKMTSVTGGLGSYGFGGFHYFAYTITVTPPSREQLFLMVRHWH